MRLAGRLENLGLSNMLHDVHDQRLSGTLHLQFSNTPDSQKGAYLLFFQGRLITCYETPNQEELANEFVRLNLLKANQIQEALRTCMEKEIRLEKVILEKGFLKPSEWENALRVLFMNRLQSYLASEGGTYSFCSTAYDQMDHNSPDLSLTNEEIYFERGMELAPLFEEINHGFPDPHKLPDEVEVEGSLGSIQEGVSSLFYNLSGELGLSTDHMEKIDDNEMVLLGSMLNELHHPLNVEAIPLLLLRYGSLIFQRGILLKVEKNRLKGIGGFGFQLTDKEEGFSNVFFSLETSGMLAHVLERKELLKGRTTFLDSDHDFFSRLGGDPPDEVFLGPIFSRKKPMALFYGDFGQNSLLNPKCMGFEIFLTQIGLALEKKFLQERIDELEG